MRYLAVVVVTIVLGTSQLAASDKEIVVEVESVRGVAA
jgi:hypothetical protein